MVGIRWRSASAASAGALAVLNPSGIAIIPTFGSFGCAAITVSSSATLRIGASTGCMPSVLAAVLNGFEIDLAMGVVSGLNIVTFDVGAISLNNSNTPVIEASD